MNAILRERDEAPVLTNEAIEVHLTYLRAGLDAVQADVPALRDKIDQLSEKVDSKIAALSDKTDARFDDLSRKIDKANEDRIAGDAMLSQKIDALSQRTDEKFDKLIDQMSKFGAELAKTQGHMKSLLWVLSSSSVVAMAAWIAKTLNWV